MKSLAKIFFEMNAQNTCFFTYGIWRGFRKRCVFSKSSSKVLDFLHTAMGENSYEEGTWQRIEHRKGCYGKQCMIRKFSETSNSFPDFYL